MRLLPDGIFDLLVADPPYGIGFTGKEGYYNDAFRNRDEIADGYVDVDPKDYERFSREWIPEAVRLLKPRGSGYIVSGWTHLGHVLSALKSTGVELTNHIIWRFPFGVYANRHYVTSHYHVLYFRKDPRNYTFNPVEKYPEDVWNIDRCVGKVGSGNRNGNQLPFKLVERFILEGSNEGDTVLDPFMGIGTTAHCAQALDRHFFGYEINENAYRFWKDKERIAAQGKGLFV